MRSITEHVILRRLMHSKEMEKYRVPGPLLTQEKEASFQYIPEVRPLLTCHDGRFKFQIPGLGIEFPSAPRQSKAIL